MSVVASYSNLYLINISVIDNWCYSAFLFDKGSSVSITNFSCINNNNILILQGTNQDFGSCLDLKNTRNATITNVEINSCFSQKTTCGIKIFLEIENDRNTPYNEVFINLIIFFRRIFEIGQYH